MFSVTTNAGAVDVSGPDWCDVIKGGNGNYSVTVSGYSGNERTGDIALSINEGKITRHLFVTQYGNGSSVFTVGDDIKIPVSGATASETGSPAATYGIEKSFDGDMNTFYCSVFSGSFTAFPVTLTYNFTDVPNMEYLVYRAPTLSYSKFKELEIWVADKGGSTLRKYGDFNFNGGDACVVFNPPLDNPTKVEFRVKSGISNYVTCAEMEFYRRAPIDFDYLTIFTDPSCSSLKAGVTRETIDGITDMFFKDLALKMFLNIYDETGFRVQEYRAWVHPDVQAAANKTAAYSLRDNPTGIYVTQDEELLVFVGDIGQALSLVSQDLSTGGWGTQHSYPLFIGLNKIKAKADGLLYLQYYSPQGEDAPKVTINFATGKVNGYFDSQKHQEGDWGRLLDAAVAGDFDLVGKYVHLTFPVATFKTRTSSGKALIDKWDEMLWLEHEFMGLYKYDRVFKNRLYGHVEYRGEPMLYAASYHTGYHHSQINDLLDPAKFSTTAIWGPAHEAGHVNQVRPGLVWSGMTEVTNNIYSLHVQTSFGNPSRLLEFALQAGGGYASAFTNAFINLRGKNKPHNETTGGVSVFEQLVPFWQLKLYLCDALGKTDFYKDLFYYYMTNPNPGTAAETDGRYQLHFVRMACQIAGLDLTYFFEQWGFLTPIDTGSFKITPAQIDALKTEIASQKYPKPAMDFTGITDANVATYK
jgi:hypothetical protein